MTLARNAFSKTLNTEQLKARVLEKFVSGLNHPVGSRVRCSLPKRLEEAIMIATVIEAEMRKTGVHSNEQQQVKVRETGKPRYQGKLPINRAINEKRFQNGRYPNQRTQNRTIHAVGSPGTREIRCFKCFKNGHIARECPQKQSSSITTTTTVATTTTTVATTTTTTTTTVAAATKSTHQEPPRALSNLPKPKII